MNVEPATACAFVRSAGRACARRVGCAHARSVRAACKACEACEGCACNSCAFESCEAFTRKACEVPFMKRSHQACVCKARVCKCMSAAHARAVHVGWTCKACASLQEVRMQRMPWIRACAMRARAVRASCR
uniref:Uncharacterized protein n=1 Tax=Chrysotila carterae TaxID=13221 RepID=A0A7S4EWT6_CHRCT